MTITLVESDPGTWWLEIPRPDGYYDTYGPYTRDEAEAEVARRQIADMETLPWEEEE